MISEKRGLERKNAIFLGVNLVKKILMLVENIEDILLIKRFET